MNDSAGREKPPDGERRPPWETTQFDKMSTEELMKLCEAYWQRNHSATFNGPDYNSFVMAMNELGNRGPAILPWARSLLKSSDYEVRETAGWWIGELGARGELGSDADSVLDDLSEAALRHVVEDNKEIQAVEVAIDAIGKLGNARGIPVLGRILLSEHPDHDEEVKEQAAVSLGALVGEDFDGEDDPVMAATRWLRMNSK